MLSSATNIVALCGLVGAAAGAPTARQEDGGFVTTNGQSFQLDGEDFVFAGSNAYYFPFSGVRTTSAGDVLFFTADQKRRGKTYN